MSVELFEHFTRLKITFEISRCETILKSGLESKDDLLKDKMRIRLQPWKEVMSSGSEYKLETWTEKKNDPE